MLAADAELVISLRDKAQNYLLPFVFKWLFLHLVVDCYQAAILWRAAAVRYSQNILQSVVYIVTCHNDTQSDSLYNMIFIFRRGC